MPNYYPMVTLPDEVLHNLELDLPDAPAKPEPVQLPPLAKLAASPASVRPCYLCAAPCQHRVVRGVETDMQCCPSCFTYHVAGLVH